MHYNLKWIAQIHKQTMDNSSFYKELMTWVFYVIRNAPKSCTMQVMWGMYAQRVQSMHNGIIK